MSAPGRGVRGGGQVVGVVLAAGAGARFGGPKVLAADGRWLRTAVDALVDGGCDRVVVTLGAAVVDVPHPAISVVVGDWAEGLSASVRAGLDAAVAQGADTGVVLLVVDTPDTRADHVRRVLAASRRHPDSLARAVFGGRPGHPVYLGAHHLAAVRAGLAGDRGAGAFLAGRGDVVDVECGDLSDGHDIDR
ncbi:MAG: NTP transferase domain-containing protein [Corynebacteriales bacterium]|uniref:NTP transferase domain-containing protein n=1 Tax=Williamsia herbipolensis TaxID=1603258 RepID=A0AAU4K848_9NOCA|nr:NTP transferase domain-containing protein [Williamsia herbipolensis]MCX6469567.1 NTP transferase domain-containing protein [Mycobacteriales bacterium]